MRTVLLIALLVSAVALAQGSDFDETELDSVLRAVEWQVEKRQPYLRRWVVLSGVETSIESRCLTDKPPIERLRNAAAPRTLKELLSDFESRNREPVRIRQSLFTNFVQADVRSKQLENGYDWAALRKEHVHADAVLEVCRPGFNKSGDLAIVRTFLTKYDDDSLPSIFLLRRNDSNSWNVISAAIGK